MAKKKKERKRRRPYNVWPGRPRLAQSMGDSFGLGAVVLAVECWDPRCECAPGGTTWAPVPAR